MNERLIDQVDGQAVREPGDIAVLLTKPRDAKLSLDRSIVFPTEHVRRIIDAARAGKSILEFPVYDGSEKGEKIYNTLTVVGRMIPPSARVPTDAAAGQQALAGLNRWPVTGSYFDRAGAVGGQTPGPIRRYVVPSVSRASSSRPQAKIFAASWVGWPNDCARVRRRKSAVLSFSVTVAPASALALSRAETFSDRRHKRSSSWRNSAMSWSNVVSAEMLLVSRSALTGRSSMPRASRARHPPSAP